MQVENILNKRVVLRGIEAVRLVMRQPGSLHRAALRQIPRIAEQVKFCRTEGEQQHEAAGPQSEPAGAEHMERLLQEHFSREIAHKRARTREQQHIPEVIRRIAGKQLRHQCAEHQRTADREHIQRHRPQPADCDHIAAAFHLAVLQQQERAQRKHEPQRSQRAEIVPALEARGIFHWFQAVVHGGMGQVCRDTEPALQQPQHHISSITACIL